MESKNSIRISRFKFVGEVKLLPVVRVCCVGRAMMSTLFAASVTLNASPIAYPAKVRELIHGEFMIFAVPVRREVASCPNSMEIVGAINGLQLPQCSGRKSLS
jgi:hypothetical protein